MDSIIPQGATPQKQCSKCKQWKPATLEFFTPNRPERQAYKLLAARCKECRNVYQRQKYALTHPTEAIPEGYKHCPKCENDYPATTEFFGADKWAKDGLTFRCKPCRNAAQKLRKRRKSPRKLHLPQPNPTKNRHCPECGQDKLASVENFHLNSHNKDGLFHVCRDCHKGYVTRLAEERAAKPQEPTRTCTGPCGRTLPATREYFPSEIRGMRRRCKECREKERKANYELNEEDRKASRRVYLAANREMARTYNRNRSAHQRNATGSHTAQDIQDQLKRQKGKCYYCGIKLGTGKRAYHVDHVVPLSRGGSNDISNLVIACHSCNERKQDKLLHEWPEGGRLF